MGHPPARDLIAHAQFRKLNILDALKQCLLFGFSHEVRSVNKSVRQNGSHDEERPGSQLVSLSRKRETKAEI